MILSNQSIGVRVRWLDALPVETVGAMLPCEHVRECLELIAPAASGSALQGETVRDLASHVAMCPACRREYEDLCWILHEMGQTNLHEPAFYPSPDLSFLPGCPSQPVEERLAGLVRLAVGA